MTVTTIDILRHGACDDGDILRGRTDSSLSPLGQEQMYRALRELSGWQRVVTSPFARCCAFAEEFTERLHIPLSIQPEWREVDFGIWDGRLLADIRRDDPDTLDRYYREPGSVTPAGGEPLPLASERVVKAWRRLLTDCRGEHLLLISHGGAIRLLLAALQGAPLSASHFFDIPYGSLTRLRVYHGDDGDFIRLVSHGIAHRETDQ